MVPRLDEVHGAEGVLSALHGPRWPSPSKSDVAVGWEVTRLFSGLPGGGDRLDEGDEAGFVEEVDRADRLVETDVVEGGTHPSQKAASDHVWAPLVEPSCGASSVGAMYP